MPTPRLPRALLLLAFLFVPVAAQDACDDGCTEIDMGDDEPERGPLDFDGGRLTLDLAKLAGLDRQSELDEQLRAWWTGTIGTSNVVVEVRVYPVAEFTMYEPEQVARFLEQWYADPEHDGDPDFRFSTWRIVRGKYGAAPFACLATGKIGKTGEALVVGGVYPALAYSVTVEAKPELDTNARDRILAFLRGVRSECKPRDPNWTKREIVARWGRAPRKVFRTKHYIVMTNSGAGNLFAKKMEEWYAKIHEVFPIPEVEGRRLMPVFLFRDKSQYSQFGREVTGMARGDVYKTKGHAYRDYYATYYDSPNAAVHSHEATHQIFTNRLFLDGGGSWFQEGVAEYICTNRSKRRSVARSWARSGSRPPLRAMIREEQLSGKYYGMAATVIEYLRDSKELRARFPEFIQTLGRIQTATPERVDAAFKSVYGLGFEAIGVGWVRYWKR